MINFRVCKIFIKNFLKPEWCAWPKSFGSLNRLITFLTRLSEIHQSSLHSLSDATKKFVIFLHKFVSNLFLCKTFSYIMKEKRSQYRLTVINARRCYRFIIFKWASLVDFSTHLLLKIARSNDALAITVANCNISPFDEIEENYLKNERNERESFASLCVASTKAC